MKKITFIISLICLGFTLIPSFLVFFEVISMEVNKNLMFTGTIGWFLTAPFWMNQKEGNSNAG